jgi:hypothetical protein
VIELDAGQLALTLHATERVSLNFDSLVLQLQSGELDAAGALNFTASLRTGTLEPTGDDDLALRIVYAAPSLTLYGEPYWDTMYTSGTISTWDIDADPLPL